MKRAWIAIVVAVVAFPAVAVAQDGMAAWCGGSYGAQGTNFGGCVSADQNVQLAGQGSGVRQGVSVETRPEYPSSMVTFEDGKAMFIDSRSGVKRPLNLNWMPVVDHSGDIQSPGGSN
jgi:hypothetical protein